MGTFDGLTLAQLEKRARLNRDRGIRVSPELQAEILRLVEMARGTTGQAAVDAYDALYGATPAAPALDPHTDDDQRDDEPVDLREDYPGQYIDGSELRQCRCDYTGPWNGDACPSCGADGDGAAHRAADPHCTCPDCLEHHAANLEGADHAN